MHNSCCRNVEWGNQRTAVWVEKKKLFQYLYMMKCSNVSSWRNHDVNYFVLQWASIRLWTTTTMNPRHWLQRMRSINTMRSSPLLVRLASVCKYPGHPVTEIILCNIFHTVYVQSGMTPASKVAISEDPGTQLENPMLDGTHINAKSGISSEGKKHTRPKQNKPKKVKTVCQWFAPYHVLGLWYSWL